MGTMRCERRNELSQMIPGMDEKDPDFWKSDGTCNYCGSMNPDQVLVSIKSGVEVIPTDKGYKIYLGGAGSKAYFQHFEEKHKKEFIELLNNKTMKVGVPGHFYVLPYFMKEV